MEDRAAKILTHYTMKVVRDARCKEILLELLVMGATDSNRRVSIRELARRVGCHPYTIVRLLRGGERHKPRLRYFVYYPERRSHKGIYLTPLGKAIAEAIIGEEILDEAKVKKLVKKAIKKGMNVTAMSPQRHRNVTAMSPQCHRNVTAVTNTLIHYYTEDSNTLRNKSEQENSKVPNDKTSERLSLLGETQKTVENGECERCGRKTKLTKFKPSLRSTDLIHEDPHLARYYCAYVCETCLRELYRTLVRIYKRITEGSDENAQRVGCSEIKAGNL